MTMLFSISRSTVQRWTALFLGSLGIGEPDGVNEYINYYYCIICLSGHAYAFLAYFLSQNEATPKGRIHHITMAV
jgi:hypothetical protein